MSKITNKENNKKHVPINSHTTTIEFYSVMG